MTPPPRGPRDVGTQQSYVYLLRSREDKQHYRGWTRHLRRRLAEHNEGLVASTKVRVPLILVAYETYSSPGEAKQRERILKRNPNMLACFKKRVPCAPCRHVA